MFIYYYLLAVSLCAVVTGGPMELRKNEEEGKWRTCIFFILVNNENILFYDEDILLHTHGVQ